MDSGKLVETAVRDLGVTAGPWPLEYDGSLAIGGQVAISPASIGPDDVSLDERKANIRLFAVSRELYGHADLLACYLEDILAGNNVDRHLVRRAIDIARRDLSVAKRGGAR
jgi:hypothetical protein